MYHSTMQTMHACQSATPFNQTRRTPVARQWTNEPTPSSLPMQYNVRSRDKRTAALGGGPEEDKKFITREEEPDQFWQTKTEKKGQNPAQDPLALMGIAGILLPFIILGIAIATGVVDLDKGKL